MTDAGTPRQWMGQYLWAQDSPRTGDQVALFRTTFDLTELPSTAALHIDADSRFVAYVNGLEAARGPVRSQPRRRRYWTVQVLEHLRVGVNTLAISVRHYGAPLAWYQPAGSNRPCVIADLEIGARRVVSTDATWRALSADAWQPQRARGIGEALAEVIDARRLPVGWITDTFDDSSWKSAHVLAARHIGTKQRTRPPVEPFGALRPPATPVPTTTRLPITLAPFTATSPTEWQSITALDGVRIGPWELRVTAPEGTTVILSIAEDLDADGQLGVPQPTTRFTYVARGLADEITTFDRHGGRFVAVQVVAGSTPLERSDWSVESLTCIEHIRPRAEGAYFRCSDERLNAIFAIGQRTVDACALDVYVDCPTREQRAWTGDFVVHQMVDFVTNADWSLPLHHTWLSASPRSDGMLPMAVAGDIEASDAVSIPDWALHWVHAVHNVMLWSGESDLILEMMRVVDGVVRWFEPYVGANGLLYDVPGWALIDWATIPTAGASASMTALWARALREAAELARWCRLDGFADHYDKLYARVRIGFAEFWDERRGVYLERLDTPGQETNDGTTRLVTQHANATAVIAGLVPPGKQHSVMTAITDRSVLVRHSAVMGGGAHTIESGPALLFAPYPAPTWNLETTVLAAEPFFRYIVHDAMLAAGLGNDIVDALQDWWPWVEAGETTWPETWHGGTHCHGWSSTPTRDLLTAVAGIRPCSPGFAAATIRPALGDLSWLEARVPTPHGWIEIRATADDLVVSSPVPWSG